MQTVDALDIYNQSTAGSSNAQQAETATVTPSASSEVDLGSALTEPTQRLPDSGIPYRVKSAPISLRYQYQERVARVTGGKLENSHRAIHESKWLAAQLIELYVDGNWRSLTVRDLDGASELPLTYKDGGVIDEEVGKQTNPSQQPTT